MMDSKGKLPPDEAAELRKLLWDEEHLQLLLDNSPVSIMACGEDGTISFVNDWHITHFAKCLHPKEYFLGRKLWELPGIVSAGVGDQVRAILSGQSMHMDDVYVPCCSSGTECYQSMHGVPLSEDGKVVGGLLIRQDITERKQLDASALKTQERLELALDGASDGAWDWNMDTGESYFSPRYYTMLGYEPDEFEG